MRHCNSCNHCLNVSDAILKNINIIHGSLGSVRTHNKPQQTKAQQLLIHTSWDIQFVADPTLNRVITQNMLTCWRYDKGFNERKPPCQVVGQSDYMHLAVSSCIRFQDWRPTWNAHYDMSIGTIGTLQQIRMIIRLKCFFLVLLIFLVIYCRQ